MRGDARDGTGRDDAGTDRREATRARATDSERSQERILKSIHELYERGPSGAGGAGTRGTTIGLLDIANDALLRVKCFKPRKKVSAMIIGNHSAGKSSFINWYIGESVQTTGVAIETRGFTFVTSGRKRETLKGDATLAFYDYLEGLQDVEGLNANIFTEISTSKEKNFSCVDIVDSPGLVDGEMCYPFDVSKVITWLADHVDLILCFFDPIGQALCKRTMTVIESLNEHHADKLAYYMSKADQVEKEHDRQRVLIQITQNLSSRIKNSHAFKLPTIYLPRDDLTVPIPNAIEEVCEDIDRAIRLTVQKNLTTMKEDCTRIEERINEVIETNDAHKKENMKRSLRGVTLMIVGWFFLFMSIYIAALEVCATPVIAGGLRALFPQSPQLERLLLPQEGQVRWSGVKHGGAYALSASMVVYFIIQYVKHVVWRLHTLLTKKELARLQQYKQYVGGFMEIRAGLYKDYFASLHQSQG